MSFKFARTLAVSTALGAAAFLGAHAIAQTSAPNAAPNAPAQTSPESAPRGPGAGMGREGMGMGMGREGMGRDGMGYGRMGRGDDERGWRRGEGRMGQGYGQGYGYGYGQGYRGEGRGRMGQMSEIDRQAMQSARIAAAKAALLLTPEQEKLWGPFEAAIRDGLKQRQDWRARMEKEGPAANPVDRMKRMGEMASARGAALTRLADAAGPLYSTLSDDQKRRLRFVRGIAGMGGGMGAGMGGGMMHGQGPGMGMGGGRGYGEGMRGHRHHEHHGYHHRGYGERGYGRGEGRL
jgi:zinc resistance-associated protein